MKTERIPIQLTPRLERERDAWIRHGRRPENIVKPSVSQESVWDYPRPPAVERVLDEVRVVLDEKVIIETRGALRVLETASPPTYYLPFDSVRGASLEDAGGSSFCEWKGAARYHSIRTENRLVERAAWSYPTPLEEYSVLAGFFSLYPAFVDRCEVAGLLVTPQPGGFYGGWMTDNLVGPFKGGPGSSGW